MAFAMALARHADGKADQAQIPARADRSQSSQRRRRNEDKSCRIARLQASTPVDF
jgi:hypothetical protein